jgi:hypothetical protein
MSRKKLEVPEKLEKGALRTKSWSVAVLQSCGVAVKQGINPKSETLNTKQYLNPNAQILNVLVI